MTDKDENTIEGAILGEMVLGKAVLGAPRPIEKSNAEPPPPAEAFLPMAQGTATNKFRATATKNIRINRNGNAMIEQKGFKASILGYSKIKGGLSTGAKKLLDAGSMKLTANNHFREKNMSAIDKKVLISLQEYGQMRGYDILPHTTSTPEEEKAEKKRLANVMCEIRKRANAELELLFNLYLTWTEPGRKKASNHRDIRVLQETGIIDGYIYMYFSDTMAAYLIRAYIMQYPMALQTVDERNPRTYKIGYKLALHHSNDNNRAKGTNNIISVKALLDACGDIPTYEEVQASKNRGHWERLIKGPLESALDSNLSSGVITSWEYCNSKCLPLNDVQINIADYPTFIALYIHFEMANEPDQSERLQRKEERKKKEKKPRKRIASKKKTEEESE